MRLFALLFIYSFFLLAAAPVNAQNKAYIKAYEAYNAGEYNKAIDLFKEAYERITDKEEKIENSFSHCRMLPSHQ